VKAEVTRARSAYFEAWRWRREVEAELRSLALTLTQWLVLEATDELIRESGDAVNQNAVAARTELDRMTISQVMRGLAERSLVERGSDSTGRAYRVVVTRQGRGLLKRAQPRVEAATRRFRGEE
jgi:DNA-binding MarR family transcriptional regulator